MTALTTHGEQLLEINGVDLCVETFGDQADPPVLLVALVAAVWDAFVPALIRHAGRGRS